MRSRVWLATATAAAALVVGLQIGRVSASPNQAPVVNSGSLTVHYENTYTINFTASDPDGDPLTIVTAPGGPDLLGCDGGPAENFSCEFSSSRYGSTDPLPTAPFDRTITYSVTDGTSTVTGTWTVTVLPPPTMNVTGEATVVEGGSALVHLQLSTNPFGEMVVPASFRSDDAADPIPFEFDVADGATTADALVSVPDDAVPQPTRHFQVAIDRMDAIPYRFVPGGNELTVLDNDGGLPADTVAPVIAAHRDLCVDRGGKRVAAVVYAPPAATDDVDGPLPVICTPSSGSTLPLGRTDVSCSATDAAGNGAKASFTVTVRRVAADGVVDLFGHHSDVPCVKSGQVLWVTAEGFSPGAQLTLFVETTTGDVTALPGASADRKGRLHTLVVLPAAPDGDADLVVTGASGPSDLMKMMPIRLDSRRHHHHRWTYFMHALSFDSSTC